MLSSLHTLLLVHAFTIARCSNFFPNLIVKTPRAVCWFLLYPLNWVCTWTLMIDLSDWWPLMSNIHNLQLLQLLSRILFFDIHQLAVWPPVFIDTVTLGLKPLYALENPEHSNIYGCETGTNRSFNHTWAIYNIFYYNLINKPY